MQLSDLFNLVVVIALLAIGADVLYTWYGAFVVGAYYASAGPFMLVGGVVLPLAVLFVISFAIFQIAKSYISNKG